MGGTSIILSTMKKRIKNRIKNLRIRALTAACHGHHPWNSDSKTLGQTGAKDRLVFKFDAGNL